MTMAALGLCESARDHITDMAAVCKELKSAQVDAQANRAQKHLSKNERESSAPIWKQAQRHKRRVKNLIDPGRAKEKNKPEAFFFLEC